MALEYTFTCPASNNDEFVKSNSAALNITGDLQVEFKLYVTNVSGGGEQELGGDWRFGQTKSWYTRINNGALQMWTSGAGGGNSFPTASSTFSTLGYSNGDLVFVQFQFDASASTVTFKHKAAEGDSWSTIGSAASVNQTALNGNDWAYLGQDIAGALNSEIFWMKIYSGLDGSASLVGWCDAADATDNTTAFTGSVDGLTWDPNANDIVWQMVDGSTSDTATVAETSTLTQAVELSSSDAATVADTLDSLPVTVVATHGQSYSDKVLDFFSGQTGFLWRMQETSGLPQDYGPAGYDATVVGTLDYSQDSRFSDARSIGYGMTPKWALMGNAVYSPDLTGAWTAGGWVRVNSFAGDSVNNGGDFTIIRKEDWTISGFRLWFRSAGTGVADEIRLSNSSTTSSVTYSPGGALHEQWLHVVGTYNGFNQFELFVNGTSAGTLAQSITASAIDWASGGGWTGVGGDATADFDLHDVFFVERQMSDGEIVDLAAWSPADVAEVAESITLAVSITSADSASMVDAGTLAQNIAVSATDTGTATDSTSTLSAVVTASDSGTETEANGGLTLEAADSGTVTETGTLSQEIALEASDSATVADANTGIRLDAADSATLVDTTVGISLTVDSSDAGTVSDAVDALSPALSAADTATGDDGTGTVSAALTATDTGSVGEGAPGVELDSVDTGTGTDVVVAIAADVEASDSVTFVGDGVDFGFSSSDSGTLTEGTPVVAVSVAASDSVTATDSNAGIAIDSSDTTAITDATAELAVALDDVDTATGTDTTGTIGNAVAGTDAGTLADSNDGIRLDSSDTGTLTAALDQLIAAIVGNDTPTLTATLAEISAVLTSAGATATVTDFATAPTITLISTNYRGTAVPSVAPVDGSSAATSPVDGTTGSASPKDGATATSSQPDGATPTVSSVGGASASVS